MPRPLPPLALLLCVLGLASTQAQADPSKPKRWSKLVNDSGRTYILTDTDLTSKSTVGALWCRKEGERGNGKKITVKGDAYQVTPGRHELYFDTTARQFAMHLKLQEGSSRQSIDLHVTTANLVAGGTEITVLGQPLSGCNLVIDFSGYRNADGGVLFTLKPPMLKAGAEDEND